MNFKGHLISEIIIFLLLWGFIKEITLTSIFIPILWGSSFPDSDLKFKSHRNILFHSVIPNVVIFLYNINLLSNLLILSVGIHLLGDLVPMVKRMKRKGFACIDIFGFYRLNSIYTILWFIGNITISILLFIIFII